MIIPPYNACFSTTQMTFFPCSVKTLSPHSSGLISRGISTRTPYSLTQTVPSISFQSKDPDMSVVSTVWSSIALITHDITIPSWVTVGGIVSSFFMQYRCLWQSQHSLPLMMVSRFPFSNIRQPNEEHQSYSVKSFGLSCYISSIVNSCITSFSVTAAPQLPNFLRPPFMFYWVVITSAVGQCSCIVDCFRSRYLCIFLCG